MGIREQTEPPTSQVEQLERAADSFRVADLEGIHEALTRLLDYETSDWPTAERHLYIERLEHLRREVAWRLR